MYNSETIPILTGIQRVMNVNVHRYSLKYMLFLLDFNVTWLSSTQFWKIFEYQIG